MGQEKNSRQHLFWWLALIISLVALLGIGTYSVGG
jgi:hypothetical protein